MQQTEKKNQHYIPKFYLRHFSYKDNKKQIGVYNIKKELYIPTAPLKNQGSRNFFYGIDGKLEDALSSIEGRFANLIFNIISSRILPPKKSPEHIDLLLFIVVTVLRSPVTIDGLQDRWDEVKKRLIESGASESKVQQLAFSHEEAVTLSMSNIRQITEIIQDLTFKLIINNTTLPFIASDFPVIRYNQFLELKKWQHGQVGFGNIGLEIFIPLNNHLMLIMYDSSIYKIGNKKDSYQIITCENDINQLNVLQFLNCIENIFFDDTVTKEYIQTLHKRASRYMKANLPTSQIGNMVNSPNEKPNLIIIGSTDCKINLSINGLKMHSGAKDIRLSSQLAQLRPGPKMILENSKSYNQRASLKL